MDIEFKLPSWGKSVLTSFPLTFISLLCSIFHHHVWGMHHQVCASSALPMGHLVVVGLQCVGKFDCFDHASSSALIYLHQLICLATVTTSGHGALLSLQDSSSGIGLMVQGSSGRLPWCLGVCQIVLISPHCPLQSSCAHALKAGWLVQGSSWFLLVSRLCCVGLMLSKVSKPCS